MCNRYTHKGRHITKLIPSLFFLQIFVCLTFLKEVSLKPSRNISQAENYLKTFYIYIYIMRLVCNCDLTTAGAHVIWYSSI